MYESTSQAPIVVGVDGSKVTLETVECAAAEAAARHRRLRVVHAFIRPLLRVPVGLSTYGSMDGGLQTLHNAFWMKPYCGPRISSRYWCLHGNAGRCADACCCPRSNMRR